MSEIYHVLSRGVDRRKIFMDDRDRMRFIHDLFEFNDQQPVNNSFHRFSQNNNIVSHHINVKKRPRKLLVDLLAFCLMPNHYHLLLRPRIERGISQFMKKLNIGYAKYFNERYKRTGTLFEGRYKSIIVNNDAHFIHLPYYIHLNPLDLKFKEWRSGELRSVREAMKFLNSYRWSSHLDYMDNKNFPSVTQRNLLNDFWGGAKNYKKGIAEWLKELDSENIFDIKDLILED